MDTFLTKAIKSNPKFYTIIGLLGGIILGYFALSEIPYGPLVGFFGGVLFAIGMAGIPYWNYKQPKDN